MPQLRSATPVTSRESRGRRLPRTLRKEAVEAGARLGEGRHLVHKGKPRAGGDLPFAINLVHGLLAYLLVGPYVNITMLHNPLLPSLVGPLVGIALMLLIIAIPRWFPRLTVMFAVYSLAILVATA